MKLTLKKISLLSIMEKVIEITKNLTSFKSEVDTKGKQVDKKIEDIQKQIGVGDEKFSTMEKVVTYTKGIETSLNKVIGESIPEVNKTIETKANKTDVDALRKLATKNETDIATLGRDKVDKKDHNSLQAKVTSIESTTSSLAQNKANKTDLANYYNKNETVGKIAEEIHKIVGAAPEALDTLKELSDAINNDPSFGANLINDIAKKVSKDELAVVNDTVNLNRKEIAKIQGQKFLTIVKANHEFKFDPVFYSPNGWVKADSKNNMPAEGMALRLDDNKFAIFFDGIVTIPAGTLDDANIELSNGEFYLLSKNSGKVTKEEYNQGLVQGLFKVINDNGVKKAFIMLEQPIML